MSLKWVSTQHICATYIINKEYMFAPVSTLQEYES